MNLSCRFARLWIGFLRTNPPSQGLSFRALLFLRTGNSADDVLFFGFAARQSQRTCRQKNRTRLGKNPPKRILANPHADTLLRHNFLSLFSGHLFQRIDLLRADFAEARGVVPFHILPTGGTGLGDLDVFEVRKPRHIE